MTGDYLERLEYHLGAYREDDDSEVIDNPVAYRWLTVGDQRAAVAELKRLRAVMGENAAMGVELERIRGAQQRILAEVLPAVVDLESAFQDENDTGEDDKSDWHATSGLLLRLLTAPRVGDKTEDGEG